MNQFVPNNVKEKFDVYEWRNGLAILAAAHAAEWQEILTLLSRFQLTASAILEPGGSKSSIANSLDKPLIDCGWQEKNLKRKSL